MAQGKVAQRGGAATKNGLRSIPPVDHLSVESKCPCGVYVLVRKNLAKKTRFDELVIQALLPV
jgi:hypothetical protein